MRIWREVFLEVALRAIRRTHYEYGIWELGQKELILDDFSSLNQGLGIYYAPEETVRDAISQEIMLTGLWKKHTIEKELRSYWIDREVRIEFELNKTTNSPFIKELFSGNETGKKYFDIDIVFKRIEEKTKDGQETLPTLIEAKRYSHVNIDLQTKEIKIGRPQLSAINKDIAKLKLLLDLFENKPLVIKSKPYKCFRIHLLVWGIAKKGFNIRTDFISKLKYGKYLSLSEKSIKYLPIQWDSKMNVKKYLWIGLFEIV